MQCLKVEKRAACEKLRRVEAKLAELIETESIEVHEVYTIMQLMLDISTLPQVEDEINSDLIKIMEQNTSDVMSKYEDGSFPVLFWKEQQKSAMQTEELKEYALAPFHDKVGGSWEQEMYFMQKPHPKC